MKLYYCMKVMEKDSFCEYQTSADHESAPEASGSGRVERLVRAREGENSENRPVHSLAHSRPQEPLVSQTRRDEQKLNEEDLCKIAERFREAGAATIMYELRLIRDQAYSIGYRHGFADAATDLGA